jgi:glycosyltransferase involved in cell wall biosynthesis
MNAADTLVPGAAVEPQRLLIVLPSTGEFDSRTWRIASSAARRGHDVTVLARSGPGLPDDERHPDGYRIQRISAHAVDGLPGPLSRIARAFRRRNGATPPSASSSGGGREGLAPGGGQASQRPADERVWLPRRVARDVLRRWAILLTIRAYAKRAAPIAPPADLIHGMAYLGIPVALRLADGHRPRARVVYDARDIYVDAANLARMRGLARWAIARAERGWARRSDRVITVNDPYADVMTERFGVERPLVVWNCAYRFKGDPRDRRFHAALGLPAETPIVLYQGGFSRDRGIEQLIDSLASMPGVVLVLMGYGSLEAELRARAAEPRLAGRLHVLPAVPPSELLHWVASADVVAMPIQPTTLNHRLTTPNKLFEAMAAGVPLVASDLPGMAGIVRETGCGLLVDPTDPEAIAAACRRILEATPEERGEWRVRARQAADTLYNWEQQAETLLGEYGRLTGRPW